MCKMVDIKHIKNQTSKKKLKCLHVCMLPRWTIFCLKSYKPHPGYTRYVNIYFNYYGLHYKLNYNVMSVRHHGKVTLAKL